MSPALKTIRTNPDVYNWEWHRGYLGDSVENEYPFRVADSGSNNGLEMTLKLPKPAHTTLCSRNDEEFLITLSAPGETVEFSENRFDAAILTDTRIEIEPKMTITSDAIRNYAPDKRRCTLDSENGLAFFKFYSDLNCRFECLSNYTAMMCGCVPFYMPRMYFPHFGLSNLIVSIQSN